MPASRYIFGTLPWYSVLMVTAIVAALLIATREEKRLSLPKDTTVDLALWLIPSGVVGARLYYVFFAWPTFADDPISVLYIWQGGLAIYGAIIGGALAAVCFSRKQRIPMTSLLDMVAPGLILAQAIGRWGNFFNMEAYGLAVTDPAWQFFPAAVLIHEGGGQVWHMATFFYESMWNLMTFAVLMLFRRRMTRRGDVFCWYVLLYGGGRLIIEGLRLDSLMSTGGSARVSQLLSVVMCLTILVIFALRLLRRPSRRAMVIGLSGGAVNGVLVLLLPQPEEAFFAYNIAFIVQTAWVAGTLCMLMADGRLPTARRCTAWIPLLCVAWTFMIRWHLAAEGVTGFGASTLLCGLFTLTSIASGVWLYPAGEAVCAAGADAVQHDP